MLDIGMSEMVIIGVVSLIVVGPKDLPQMFRKVGTFVGKARGMAREFQSAMHDAAENSGVNDIKSTYNKATNFKDMGLEDLQLGPEYSADLKPAEDIPSVAPTTNKTVAKKTTKKKVVKKAK